MISVWDIKELIREPEIYEAHIKESSYSSELLRERLEEHINRTEKYFYNIWEQKHFDDFLEKYRKQMAGDMSNESRRFWRELIYGIPFFHDMGKINPVFQTDKMKNLKVKDDGFLSVCVSSRHSLISAVLYIDYFLQKLKDIKVEKEEKGFLRKMIVFHSYIIARHHSDLCDFDEYEQELLRGNGCSLIKIFASGKVRSWQFPFLMDEKRMSAILKAVHTYMDSLSWEGSMALYIYEKLLYSMLVAADYYATAEFMSGTEVTQFGSLDEIQEWAAVYESTKLMQSVRKYQKEQYPQPFEILKKEKNINVLRTEMLCDAEKVLEENRRASLFYLEAPTGSGKSNTAIDLSFRLMETDTSLQKIYYIYPFNTLVEQNVQSLLKIFGKRDDLAEKIAVVNSLTPIKMTEKARKAETESEATMYYQRALLDRQFLNYPMIISTHVSLFDTIFGYTKESAFGFHQLMNSVVVLDEIQSYKNSIWGEMAYFLKELARLMNMKIIIMSATLPDLDLLTGNIYPAVKLMKHKEKYFVNKCFKNRVDISYGLLGKEDVEEILKQNIKKHAIENQKVLIEFIKKDSAYRFFEMLKSDEDIAANVEYMSGDDSIAERNRILQRIKTADGGMILVATQVIEAGVDIDMDVGYKNISKLDSEEQFLGRINRSCLRHGKVWFFKLDDGRSIYRGDVRIQPEFTLENEEIQDVLTEKDFSRYYKRVLNVIKKNWNESTSEVGLEEFFRKSTGRLKWREVEKKMQLIEDDQWSMSVYLSRVVQDESGNVLNGRLLWEQYVNLLADLTMDYAEKKVRLSEVTSKMNNFIYQIKKNPDLAYNDKVGEIFYIEDGEKYFNDGKLERGKLQNEIGDFVDFI